MKRILVLAIGLVLAFAATARAADSEKKEWFEKIKIKGDFRLRYEKFDWDDRFDDGDRDRFRFRLRVGTEAQVSDGVKVGFELRSGNPDNPHSDNQSLDGGFDKKEIAIAQAYVRLKARDNISITAGKFSPKKLWIVSDMQYDDDVVAEGVLEEFDWKLGNKGNTLELNLYQFSLEESGSGSDAYLFGGQIAPTFKLNDENSLTVGAGYDSISHPERVVALTTSGSLLTEPGGFITNLVDPVTLRPVSDFRVANAFAIWKNKAVKGWPIKLSLFYYKNTGTENVVGSVYNFVNSTAVATANADDNDTAFFAKLQIGDYKKPGDMAFILRRYDSDPDAIFYAYVQSDTVRGSNADAYRFDFRYGMPRNDYINVTWYQSDWTLGDDETMDRLQVDYIFKF